MRPSANASGYQGTGSSSSSSQQRCQRGVRRHLFFVWPPSSPAATSHESPPVRRRVCPGLPAFVAGSRASFRQARSMPHLSIATTSRYTRFGAILLAEKGGDEIITGPGHHWNLGPQL
ncbi:hypothetical protein SEVIR_8G173052v4 [Setaria viridis]